MTLLARTVAATAALLLIAGAGTAHAQEHPNAQAAQLLFDDAKRAAEQHDYAAACPMFVRSHKLDPAGGTILHAADCHEHQGKLATAWAEYNEALSFAMRPPKRVDRESIARERIAALAPKLAKLHVKLSGNETAPEIWLDGARVASNVEAKTTIPVDAGRHSVELRAEGAQPLMQSLELDDGEEATVIFPALLAEGRARPPGHAPPHSEVVVVRRAGGVSNAQKLGIALGAAGAASVVVGAVFGIRAASIGDQSERCTLGPAAEGCPADVVERQNQARSAGVASTVGFVVGAGLLATGITIYVLAPRLQPHSSAALRVRVGTGVSLAGAF